MKKIFLFVVSVIVIGTNLSAQGTFGVRVGMNAAKLRYSGDGVSESMDARIGFHVGMSYEWQLTKQIPLSLETGLYGSLLGDKQTATHEHIGSAEVKNSLLYLQVPILLGYTFDVGSNVGIKPFAGLNFGLGLVGKQKIEIQGESATSDNMFKKIDGERVFKRGDMGCRIGVGIYFARNFYGAVSYEWGLTNILNDDDYKIKNRNFMITLGYNF